MDRKMKTMLRPAANDLIDENIENDHNQRNIDIIVASSVNPNNTSERDLLDLGSHLRSSSQNTYCTSHMDNKLAIRNMNEHKTKNLMDLSTVRQYDESSDNVSLHIQEQCAGERGSLLNSNSTSVMDEEFLWYSNREKRQTKEVILNEEEEEEDASTVNNIEINNSTQITIDNNSITRSISNDFINSNSTSQRVIDTKDDSSSIDDLSNSHLSSSHYQQQHHITGQCRSSPTVSRPRSSPAEIVCLSLDHSNHENSNVANTNLNRDHTNVINTNSTNDSRLLITDSNNNQRSSNTRASRRSRLPSGNQNLSSIPTSRHNTNRNNRAHHSHNAALNYQAAAARILARTSSQSNYRSQQQQQQQQQQQYVSDSHPSVSELIQQTNYSPYRYRESIAHQMTPSPMQSYMMNQSLNSIYQPQFARHQNVIDSLLTAYRPQNAYNVPTDHHATAVDLSAQSHNNQRHNRSPTYCPRQNRNSNTIQQNSQPSQITSINNHIHMNQVAQSSNSNHFSSPQSLIQPSVQTMPVQSRLPYPYVHPHPYPFTIQHLPRSSPNDPGRHQQRHLPFANSFPTNTAAASSRGIYLLHNPRSAHILRNPFNSPSILPFSHSNLNQNNWRTLPVPNYLSCYAQLPEPLSLAIIRPRTSRMPDFTHRFLNEQALSNGADYETIRSYTTEFKYNRKHAANDEPQIELCDAKSNCKENTNDEETGEDKCAICLNYFDQNENIRRLPCFHLYHVECVDKWLQVNKTCPVCRKDITKCILDEKIDLDQSLVEPTF